ncbi:zinc finger E-box-binding homeobox 1b isoform X3 [Callorhinchus milii]|uniref:zinc finger E-box-binding homeobox 1b isoform X3 n=1 Tax=Callorhinchus milii TaxID=7868 RepID=UPI001C3F6EA7|nr:zinc finger E-box-binding homeobox 1b isoform X3 [Callorhinchus milii]XP_042188548.1 zinc finger E-box-binding homeobox 1b isoform X3 [Callorhinchus milii]
MNRASEMVEIYRVTNYNNVVETNSDTDDEDKLHIVEDESVTDAADCDTNALEDDLPTKHTVLPRKDDKEDENDGDDWKEDEDGTKENVDNLGPEAKTRKTGCTANEEGCDSDGDEEQSHDPNVQEYLQQGGTAVIYPEAPEEQHRLGTPEASGQEENGPPDAFAQLLTCPYCDRGYKRLTSLKEHIKYRHEKNEDNFSCSLCSYTFAYRTQLDRHVASHKSGRDQRHVVTQTSGNRKFKCTECGKAFKYKHHLKEHLRIHSGEKPYECPNCKKRFSHSGSYSSHISSKKCIGLISLNGRARSGIKTPQGTSPSLSPSTNSPARTQLRNKLENNKPLQEQPTVNQIKTEPVDYEYKTMVVTSGINCASSFQNVGFSGGTPLQVTTNPSQGVVQAVVLPTVGLVSPISINLSDIQNVLKVAVLENNHVNLPSKEPGTVSSTSVQQNSHSLISSISVPLIDQDGTTKIIINYSLEPSQLQVVPQNLKKEIPNPAEKCVNEKPPEDLSIKSEKTEINEEPVSKTCLLCNECPGGLNALHELKHYQLKNEAHSAEEGPENLPGASESTDKNISSDKEPLKNLLSLLKAYYALNAQPTSEELAKISVAVNLPLEKVKKWFEKMQNGEIPVPPSCPSSPVQSKKESKPDQSISHANTPHTSNLQGDTANSETLQKLTDSPITCKPLNMTSDRSRNNTPSPLNLSSTSSRNSQSYNTPDSTQEDLQEEPLDLSLPRQQKEGIERPPITSVYHSSVHYVQEEPLNLSCLKKEPQNDSISNIEGNPTSAKPINIELPTITTQLPTVVAISNPNGVPCLRALATIKQASFIPQVAYTYSTINSNGPESQEKPNQSNGNHSVLLFLKEEKPEMSSEVVSNADDQNDSDSTPPRKKIRKTENGMYACDLCDKIFQKSSSLLRHKYEHTGKRPHQCGICKKAFKHKHHLIEHTRLHSGEKPYQCDKCGKRFSHSGSYSQHMNHRYSYCKREAEEREGTEQEETGPDSLNNSEYTDTRTSPSHVDSDDKDSITREDESEKEEEEKDSGDAQENCVEEMKDESEEEEGEEETDAKRTDLVSDMEPEDTIDSQKDLEADDTIDSQKDLEADDTIDSQKDLEADDTIDSQKDLEADDTINSQKDLEADDTINSKKDLEADDTINSQKDLEADDTINSKKDLEGEDTINSKKDLEANSADEKM